MSVSIRAYNFFFLNPAFFYFIDFKLLRMAEMLKYLSVFISNRNFHVVFSSPIRNQSIVYLNNFFFFL